MRNQRAENTIRQRRVVAPVVALAAIAAAMILPAHGAAARYRHVVHDRHQAEPAHVRLEHHTLKVKGTNASDAIALRLAAGNPSIVQVDIGDDGSPDFTVPVAAIEEITIDGGPGDDRLRIDDTNGTLTNAIQTTIDGGPGNDTIAGGAGAETLDGGPGNDTIDGNGGNDASDLGPGDDTFVWDPGDGSDTLEGGPGTDAMVFNGAAASETVDLSANGKRLRFFRNPGNITMDTHGVERVDFNALGGADAVTVNDLTGTDLDSVDIDLAGTLGGATGDGQTDSVTVNGTDGNDAVTVAGDASGLTASGLHTTVAIQHQEPTDQLFVDGLGRDDSISATALASGAISAFLEGGDGNDAIAGGPGAETLIGGEGSDTIDGNGGNDRAALGAGNDSFVWDPGDGSDTVEGEAGTDTMVFNGAAAPETVDLSANGNRLRFFRNPGNVTMDTHEVERVLFNALGGADVVTVNDLTGTGVTSVDLDLAANPGGTTGDGQTDRVVVNGTAGNDALTVTGNAGHVNVNGLPTAIELLHADTTDRLELQNLTAADTLNTGGLTAGTIQLFKNGILVP